MKKLFFPVLWLLLVSTSANAGADTLHLQNKGEPDTIRIAKKKLYLNVRVTLVREGHSPEKQFSIKMIGDSAWSFASTSEEKLFYKYVSGELPDSLAEIIKAYIQKHQRDSLTIIHVGNFVTVASGKDSTGSDTAVKFGGDTKREATENTGNILYLLIGLVAGGFASTGWFYYRKKRKPAPAAVIASSSPDTVEKLVYKIPEDLVSFFELDRTESDLQTISETIMKKHKAVKLAMEEETARLNSIIAGKETEITNCKEDIGKKQGTIAAHEVAILKLTEESTGLTSQVIDLTEQVKRFNEAGEEDRQIATLILEKFYNPMLKAIDGTSGLDSNSQKQIVFRHTLAIAFYSASYFRIRLSTDTDDDKKNLDKLKGKSTVPDAQVSMNSRYDQLEPLIYYVMQIMKETKVEKLSDVYILGNQIVE
ncbi:MAG: LPXTG cell wall anchor domain-containing protein [Bacteroidota bacterium]